MRFTTKSRLLDERAWHEACADVLQARTGEEAEGRVGGRDLVCLDTEAVLVILSGAVQYDKVEMRKACILRGPASVLVLRRLLLDGSSDHLLAVWRRFWPGAAGSVRKSVRFTMPK